MAVTPVETVPPDADADTDARRESPEPGDPTIDGSTDLDEDDSPEVDVQSEADVEEAAEEEVDEEDPTIDEVDLSSMDFGFEGDDTDGQDEADGDEATTEGETQTSASGSSPMEVSGEKSETIETAVNEGYARLLVTGLDDEERKAELEQEFAEVFAAFRLGSAASSFADEYLFSPGEDIDPKWALLASVCVCTAFGAWMRPDSDEQFSNLTSAVRGLLGTGGDA
ncbi:hypothetical protein ZOD2009_19098 [Haladaptatus paucihalophilus DX253]|uniref:Uncharacterized protein n=1 Tax=Haladaptatus paucihalophilus DX253 TaxID=797209 RepID=E7QYC9_HALPU|nr:hypothetical protein [Haladaptatus paucihalophilus]EFW90454.1 hypothetical protein ZOD2009_19098 [Haladaptatus paucihalophilus DX253]SHL68212.1 hypothetical protein SAMN05444342_4398 [Haladaptatus paucihalophilus DX253]